MPAVRHAQNIDRRSLAIEYGECRTLEVHMNKENDSALDQGCVDFISAMTQRGFDFYDDDPEQVCIGNTTYPTLRRTQSDPYDRADDIMNVVCFHQARVRWNEGGTLDRSPNPWNIISGLVTIDVLLGDENVSDRRLYFDGALHLLTEVCEIADELGIDLRFWYPSELPDSKRVWEIFSDFGFVFEQRCSETERFDGQNREGNTFVDGLLIRHSH